MDVVDTEDELLSVFILFSDSVRRVLVVLDALDDDTEVWNGFNGAFVVGGIFDRVLVEVLDELPEFAEETGTSSDLRKKSIKSLKMLKLGSTMNSIKLI